MTARCRSLFVVPGASAQFCPRWKRFLPDFSVGAGPNWLAFAADLVLGNPNANRPFGVKRREPAMDWSGKGSANRIACGSAPSNISLLT
jgi:hypothetical protein